LGIFDTIKCLNPALPVRSFVVDVAGGRSPHLSHCEGVGSMSRRSLGKKPIHDKLSDYAFAQLVLSSNV
ncbi:MAG: hypothetical protein WBM86_25175, partial [Waterburya sp.]